MVGRLDSQYRDNVPEVDVAVMLGHPGDAEYHCGGTIAKLAAAGKRVAILDLTKGEAGSFSRADLKLDEAERAAQLLGVVWRGACGFPDGRLEDTIMSRMSVTGEIKRLRAPVVVATHWEDRHPDSLAASLLVENACFLAGLAKLDDYLPSFRPSRIVFAGAPAPSFIVDVSAHWEQKLEALRCYTTLFGDTADAIERVEREGRRLGEMIGARYGEAFAQRLPLASDLL